MVSPITIPYVIVMNVLEYVSEKMRKGHRKMELLFDKLD